MCSSSPIVRSTRSMPASLRSAANDMISSGDFLYLSILFVRL